MASEITFYTNPMSRGRMVRWLLEELGQPYHTRIVRFGAEMKSPEYLAINPMGKVPAVTLGDAVVTEVAAICAFLADAFPQAGLAPQPGTPERGLYYRWLFFGAGPVEAAVTNRACGFEVSEEQSRMAGYGNYRAVMDTLEKAVTANEYLAGSRFTAADVYLGAQIGWGMHFGTIETRPAFQDYWKRISERPAARRASEIDDALIAEQKKG